jgi:hypothetical protein
MLPPWPLPPEGPPALLLVPPLLEPAELPPWSLPPPFGLVSVSKDLPPQAARTETKSTQAKLDE